MGGKVEPLRGQAAGARLDLPGRGAQRDPVGLGDRLRRERRMNAAAPLGAPARGPAALGTARVRGVPLVVLAAITAAWAAAIAAQASGAASAVHHDDVLADGAPQVAAVLLFLAAWQVMIAAMMLPSSLPLVRLFAAASVATPGRARALAAFLGAYALVWTTFGTLAFVTDAGLHAGVNASPWLERHEWALAPS